MTLTMALETWASHSVTVSTCERPSEAKWAASDRGTTGVSAVPNCPTDPPIRGSRATACVASS
jgi:hypothetical protein